jgi:nuclear pore complex protein Nup205
VNRDFARQTIFLAQQLECSEIYIAGILYQIMSENPNIDPVNCMEKTVSTFHKRRQYLLDSLRYLLDATEAAESSEAPQSYQILAEFVLTELIPGLRGGAMEVNLAQNVFKEIEKLDVDIGKVETERRNAGSNTIVPPNGQGEHYVFVAWWVFLDDQSREPSLGL